MLALLASACGSDDDNNNAGTPQMIAVLSAFPSELAPVLAQATVDSTTTINNRVFRLGTLGGVPTIMGLTGIGLVNAANTTRAVLEQFPVTGVVVSAVAGSTLQIGDVAVPAEWSLADGSVHQTDPHWLALAATITGSLSNCGMVTANGKVQSVCLPNPPAMAIGGHGQSADTYGTTAVACTPNGGDVFGCDVLPNTGVLQGGIDQIVHARRVTADPDVADMETAAIAREAAQHGVPFIAFRATSDGAGDPLGLPGFPTQFFAYYELAAHNAAGATVGFLHRLSGAK